MIRIIDCAVAGHGEIFSRGQAGATPEIESAVDAILQDVARRGDEAVLDYCEKFDGVRPESLRVDPSEIDAALRESDPAFLAHMRQAAANIEAFHTRQKREGFLSAGDDGIVLGQRVLPMETVGLYVPGGTAALFSTVLMSAIPAKIAGVKNILMVTPPDKTTGKVRRDMLAAAAVAGVTDVFAVGGAQAIAALAYGTASVPKADKIVGPGNIFVATAKRKVYGLVDIDMVAGPSEILVFADGGAVPEHVAADMLSQAEHDKLASAVLVCESMDFAEAVAEQIESQLQTLPREEIARVSIENNGKILVVPDLEQGVAIANEIAPEHLELAVADPFTWLGKIKNAGSVFLGYNCPEAVGDYWAGPNHTLPTMGTARFSSPLSVDEFVKKSSFIYYPPAALEAAAPGIADLARREGLEGHARSAEIRGKSGK